MGQAQPQPTTRSTLKKRESKHDKNRTKYGGTRAEDHSCDENAKARDLRGKQHTRTKRVKTRDKKRLILSGTLGLAYSCSAPSCHVCVHGTSRASNPQRQVAGCQKELGRHQIRRNMTSYNTHSGNHANEANCTKVYNNKINTRVHCKSRVDRLQQSVSRNCYIESNKVTRSSTQTKPWYSLWSWCWRKS